jgi:Sec-independent protein translocase protein TatA
MDLHTSASARPEAMGDVPGICELPLTRAIVQYRDLHEMDTLGGRIEDIGLALVVDGRFASSCEALDLGSGAVKVLDLSTELVVLDWVYEPTVEHVAELITASAAARNDEALRRYSRRLGLRVLERVGFGPLTRPTFLRVGFRDICRDLDLHEGTSIRLVLGPGKLTRAHLDYDTCALVFRTAMSEPDTAFEHALFDAFPRAELKRTEPEGRADSITYHVRFALPTALREARSALGEMRRGLVALVARFEPSRYASLDRLMETFGARETLAELHIHEPGLTVVPLPPPSPGTQAVH